MSHEQSRFPTDPLLQCEYKYPRNTLINPNALSQDQHHTIAGGSKAA